VKPTADFTSHLEAAQNKLQRSRLQLFWKKIKAFGFAQCVHIPHHVRQVGPLYFKTPRKLFGICYDGKKETTQLSDR